MSRPGQIRFLSTLATFYDPVVSSLGFRRLWERVAEHGAAAAGERCLDVCTGTGGVALALADRGAEVVGLDLAPGMLARAERKARARGLGDRTRFLRMDARSIAFPDDSFDLVTCCMALHEMAEAERSTVLDEITRVARARVLVAEYRVPAQGLSARLFSLRHAFEYLESDDFPAFVRRDVTDRLACAGLRVDDVADVGRYRLWLCSTSH
ncbi:MAG: class I SAM-dependent methyltransferase [Deltaproteobacteria bacterium]|nr:class I SAM-dependent methyltransferase [Deltaproteobacteria bacterium]